MAVVGCALCAVVVAIFLLPGASQAAFPGTNGKIAFVGFGDDADGEIYTMNPDGSHRTRLTNDPGNDARPAWSPDGQKIAFVTSRDGNAEIYVMNADGSGQTRLTNDPGADLSPAWSPGGQTIAFFSNRGGQAGIYTMNADGSGQTLLASGAIWFAGMAWSPDGQRIAFVSGPDGNKEIYVMNADGSDPTDLTGSGGDDTSPDWSPDGQRITFTSTRDGGDYEIYAMNADGSDPTNLTNDPGFDASPAWSPDGQKIAFFSDRSGQSGIYVMNADGLDPTDLTEPGSTPAWGSAPSGPADTDDDGVPDARDKCPNKPRYTPTGCLRFVAMGDSVTAGFGYDVAGKQVSATRMRTFCFLFSSARSCQSPETVSYPALFASHGLPTSWYNYATSGSTVGDWLGPEGQLRDRLARLIQTRPDLTVLTLGANPLLAQFMLDPRKQWCARIGNTRQCVRRKLDDEKVVAGLQAILEKLLAANNGENHVVVFEYHYTEPLLLNGARIPILLDELNRAVGQAVGHVATEPNVAGRLMIQNPGSFDQHQCHASQPWILTTDFCIHPNRNGMREFASRLTDAGRQFGLYP